MIVDNNIGKTFSNGMTKLYITGINGSMKYEAIQTGLLKEGVEALNVVIDKETLKVMKQLKEKS